MAIGATHYTHVLTRGGFEKLEFAETYLQKKVRLYYIRDLTTERIEGARSAILRECHPKKGRTFKGETETFEQKIRENSYLIKEGKTLQLISSEEMKNHFERVLGRVSGKKDKASACTKIGNAFQSIGHYTDALQYYLRHFDVVIEELDKETAGSVCHKIGNIYDALDDYEQAQKYYQEYLKIAEDLADQELVGRVYCRVGDIYQSLGENQKALQYFKKYLEIGEKLANQEFIGTANYRMGGAYKSLGEGQKAKAFYGSASKIGNEQGHVLIELSARLELEFF